MQALPGSWSHSGLLGTLPQVVPIVSAPSKMRCAHSPDRWQGGEETGTVAAGEFHKVPQRVIFFWEKFSCSFLWLPLYKEGPDLSHSPPLQLGRGYRGQDRTRPNFQLSWASACGLPGFSTLSLFPSLRL